MNEEKKPVDKAKEFFCEIMRGQVMFHLGEVVAGTATMADKIDVFVDLIWTAGTTAAQQRLEQFSDDELVAELGRRSQEAEAP